jgi:hypothetical protein
MENRANVSALLDLWDTAKACRPADRPATLAAGFGAAASAAAAASLTVGSRDGFLLATRRQLFGHRMELLASCPRCGERLEFDLDSRDLEAASVPVDWPVTLAIGDLAIRLRPPATVDLDAVLGRHPDLNLEHARRRLFERCILDVTRTLGENQNAVALTIEDLDETIVAAVATALAELDPLADIRIALTCAACAHAWNAMLDPPSLLWIPFDAWSVGQLAAVAQLARRFHWSEREILAMSPPRRRYYLEAAT